MIGHTHGHQSQGQQWQGQQWPGSWQQHTQPPPPYAPFQTAPQGRAGRRLIPLWAGLATLLAAVVIGLAGGFMTIYRIAAPPRAATFAQPRLPSPDEIIADRVRQAHARQQPASDTLGPRRLPGARDAEAEARAAEALDKHIPNIISPSPSPSPSPTPPRVRLKGLPPALYEPKYLSFNLHHGDARADDTRHTFTSDDGLFEVTVGNSGSHAGAVTIRFRGDDDWYTLNLAAPDGMELSIGNYEDAQRFPFHKDGRPGLDFYGNGEGCNEVVGSFYVEEIAYAAADEIGLRKEIERLNVMFERRCKGSRDTVYGRLRYRR